ncbi:MAG: hypothetical protein ACREV9_09885 [Burkholderiales bacterium]
MNILGLSGVVYHDASAALLIDGKLVAAAEEERCLRVRGFAILAVAPLTGTSLLPPVWKWANGEFPCFHLIHGGEPGLYEFFAQQPKDIVVARFRSRPI